VMYYFVIITYVMLPRDDPGEMNRPCLRAGCDVLWYHGHHVSWTRQKGTGGPTKSQSTRFKDTSQEAHNRVGLEDKYRSNLLNMASRDRISVRYNHN
jgi:hypothetical protein